MWQLTCLFYCAASTMTAGILADGLKPGAAARFSSAFTRECTAIRRSTKMVARGVFALLVARFPAGEVENAKAATPKDLHNLWPA